MAIHRREHIGSQPITALRESKALEFLKDQVKAGIKPQRDHYLGSGVRRQEICCDVGRRMVTRTFQ